MMWLERAARVRTQRRHDKNKLYAMHAPEVECIGKGKARKPYEFGVKNAVVVSHQHGLMLGARTFPGNPYDGHILNAVLEQAANLTQDLFITIRQVVVDLGAMGDALHAISCAAGYNLRWLLRAVARLGIGPAFLCLLQTVLSAAKELWALQDTRGSTSAIS